jgi:hypothetical protein
MSKQTAVQWLYDELSQCMHREEVCDLVYKLEQKAKQMEREQIQDAFYHGVDIDAYNVHNKWTEAEKYYEQTHGGKDE